MDSLSMKSDPTDDICRVWSPVAELAVLLQQELRATSEQRKA